CAGTGVGLSNFGRGEALHCHQQRAERDPQGELVAVSLRCLWEVLQEFERLKQMGARFVVSRPLQGVLGSLPKVCHSPRCFPPLAEMSGQLGGPLTSLLPIPHLCPRADSPVKL